MEFIQANKTNYLKSRSETIKYIVIHYTGNVNDTAKGNANYFANTPNLSASAHYFVDGKEVCQSVKDSDTAWHVGANNYCHHECRNANSIGVELCSKKNGKGYYFTQNTIKNAVNLVNDLMNKYNIDKSRVLRHYDVTGKKCPAPLINEKEWEAFKDKLGGGDMAEVKTLFITVNGVDVPVQAIIADGVTYVRLRDVPSIIPKIKVGFQNGKPIME